MKRVSAVLTAPKTFEFVEEEIPVLQPDEFLVKTISVGLCHSDVPAYLGTSAYGSDQKGRNVLYDSVPYPVLKGHEPVGQVVEVGSAVTKFKPGDYVAGHFRGTFATYFTAKETDRFANINYLTKPRECCLAEPATCCAHIASKAAPIFGDSVAVVGAGFMGLLTMCGMKSPTLRNLVAVDFDDERLEEAKAFGATAVINPARENMLDKADELTDGKGFDVVVELTGNLGGLETAAALCRNLTIGDHKSGGRLVAGSLYSRTTEFKSSLGHELMFHSPDLIIAHPWSITDYFDLLGRSIDAYERGVFPLDKMVTHKVPFEKIDDGFQLLLKKVPGFIKGAVVFE